MAENNLFKPIPEKYLTYGHEPHWRDAAEDVAKLMEQRHHRLLMEDLQIDILGHGMLEISSLSTEDKISKNSRFANINRQLADIKRILGTATRLSTFEKSKDNKAVKATLAMFYRLDPASEARDLEMLLGGPDDDSDPPEYAPELLYALGTRRDEAFYEWLNAAPTFVTALKYARRQLELTSQHESIEPYLIGSRIPELYRELYGETRGGRQGGEAIIGPFYTFVAEVARLTMGVEKSADAIREARKRWLKSTSNPTVV